MPDRNLPLHCRECRVGKFLDAVIPVPLGITDIHLERVGHIRCTFCKTANVEHMSDGEKLNFLIGERLAAAKPD